MGNKAPAPVGLEIRGGRIIVHETSESIIPEFCFERWDSGMNLPVSDCAGTR